MSCFCKKRDTTSGPNVNDTPRSFSDQPVMSLSGSDHKRSHSSPGRGSSREQKQEVRGILIRTGIRNVCGSHDPSNLLHGLKVGAETAMHREDLLIDNGSNG